MSRHPDPSPRFLFAPLLLGVLATSVAAQGLVRDIEPASTNPGSPGQPVVFGSQLLFAANREQEYGVELWISDGTAAGTRIVKDIWPGSRSSSLGLPVVVGSRAFFAADDGVHGPELWVTDGSPTGTRMVVDLWPGERGAAPTYLVATGGTVYFTAELPGSGRELWRSDGTPAGTRLVTDIMRGTLGSHPAELTRLGSRIYFSADDATHGRELWVSDGTAAGTRLVADIWRGTRSGLRARSNRRTLKVVDQSLFFVAHDGETGLEPWSTDGSEVTLLADIMPGPGDSDPREVTATGGKVWFTAEDGRIGLEPYVSDGTARGTRSLGDLRAGRAGSLAHGFTHMEGNVYFTAFDLVHGHELWISDGTPGGTRVFADIVPGTLGANPLGLFDHNDRLFFSADTAPSGRELWSTAGPGTPVALLRDIDLGAGSSWPIAFTSFGATLTFLADDGVHGTELWRSDATAAGTARITDIDSHFGTGSWPRFFTELGDRALFVATTAAHGRELWVSDGTAAGTTLVTDLVPGTDDASLFGFAAIAGERAMFIAQDVRGVYVTDGTAAGTQLVRTFAGHLGVVDIWSIENEAWFSADDGTRGLELWRSDGTAAGTRLAADLSPRGASFPSMLTPSGGRVFGVAIGPGSQLFVSDGTPTGSRRVGPPSLTVRRNIVPWGDGVLFVGSDDIHGKELWRSDGTDSGTVPVVDLTPGAADTALETLYLLPDRVLFGLDDGVHGFELWTSDGTAPGTRRVVDLNPGAGHGFLSILRGGAAAHDTLFFVGDDGATGSALFASDGTAAGTRRCADLHPGNGSRSGIEEITAVGVGRRVVFSGDDLGGGGPELWTSDGTPAGTRRVGDLDPGPGGSAPREFLTVGDRLFFQATTKRDGQELWAMDLGDLGAPNVESYGRGCTGSSGRAPRMATPDVPTLGNLGFRVQIVGAAPNAAAAVFLGFSRAAAPLGSGCTLLVSPIVAALSGLSDAAGTLTVVQPIPNDPTLVGASLYFTGAVVDPGAAWFGAVAIADGLRVVVGR